MKPDWTTAYAILNREYPASWPADLSGAICLRIRKCVEAGNVEMAAAVAAQTAAAYFADSATLPTSIQEALNSGDGTYRP